MGDPQNHGCQYQNGSIWDDLNFECPLWLSAIGSLTNSNLSPSNWKPLTGKW